MVPYARPPGNKTPQAALLGGLCLSPHVPAQVPGQPQIDSGAADENPAADRRNGPPWVHSTRSGQCQVPGRSYP